jgi:hypothetical protein
VLSLNQVGKKSFGSSSIFLKEIMRSSFSKVFSQLMQTADEVIGMVEELDSTTKGNKLISTAEIGNYIIIEPSDGVLCLAKLTKKQYDITTNSWLFSADIQNSTSALSVAEKSNWSTLNSKVDRLVAVFVF